jgi:hypothetical protein
MEEASEALRLAFFLHFQLHPGRGVPLPFLQKRASFACPFLLTESAKSRVLLFDASK